MGELDPDKARAFGRSQRRLLAGAVAAFAAPLLIGLALSALGLDGLRHFFQHSLNEVANIVFGVIGLALLALLRAGSAVLGLGGALSFGLAALLCARRGPG